MVTYTNKIGSSFEVFTLHNTDDWPPTVRRPPNIIRFKASKASDKLFQQSLACVLGSMDQPPKVAQKLNSSLSAVSIEEVTRAAQPPVYAQAWAA